MAFTDMTASGMEPGPEIETIETDRLIASNKVEGTAVYNQERERLGSIYNLMIDKYSGQVAYAVMNFGGFLGLGESYSPVPWRALRYDVEIGGYVIDADKSRLMNAPSYRRDEDPFRDPAYGHRVYDYYNVPWYM